MASECVRGTFGGASARVRLFNLSLLLGMRNGTVVRRVHWGWIRRGLLEGGARVRVFNLKPKTVIRTF